MQVLVGKTRVFRTTPGEVKHREASYPVIFRLHSLREKLPEELLHGASPRCNSVLEALVLQGSRDFSSSRKAAGPERSKARRQQLRCKDAPACVQNRIIAARGAFASDGNPFRRAGDRASQVQPALSTHEVSHAL
jgi:hypothetical protein